MTNVFPFARGGVASAPGVEPLVYTVEAVSELLGLALGGTYVLVRNGTIPARKLGGRWVIPKVRFHEWLNSDATEEDQKGIA